MSEQVAVNAELEKLKYELNLEEARRAHNFEFEFQKMTNTAAVDSGSLALRTLVLINGGAAVAILAFLGAISKNGSAFTAVGGVADTLRLFAFGVAASVFGMTLGYIANYSAGASSFSKKRIYDHPYFIFGKGFKRWQHINIAAQVLALLAGAASLLLFVCGMLSASQSITDLLVKA